MTQIVIDPAQIRFLLSSVGDRELRDRIDLLIENPFTIRDGDGMTHTVHPGAWATLVPVLKLRLRPTLALVVNRDGSLVLRLSEDTELRVPKDEVYESWQTFGHGDFIDASMLCSPHEGPPWWDE